jgi:phosphoribosylanthranilate isomerase
MVRVKICGITREKDLIAAIDAGADAIGFVVGFKASPRNISIEKLSELSKMVPPFVSTVLVTEQNYLEANIDVINHLRIDAIQLYGCTEPERIRKIMNIDLLKPYLVGGEQIDPKSAVDGFDALLCDVYKKGVMGGTGILQDFDACIKIKKEIYPKPLILAGGLSPDNVHEAIIKVRPYGVDASSKLETSPGVKDEVSVMKFVKNAKGCDV